MIKINVNGIEYKLPADRINSLLSWLQQNGAVQVLESSNPESRGKTLINE
jgi:hypothetical protein